MNRSETQIEEAEGRKESWEADNDCDGLLIDAAMSPQFQTLVKA